MIINFYTFSKKSRSTARPSGEGTSYECILKEPSGIVNPTIRIKLSPTVAPPWNYCYIPSFGRYYWVGEWVYTMGSVWEASLSVDSLASWKDQIGAKELYVLRASAQYDGAVIDSLYPAKAHPQSYIDRVTLVTLSNRAGTSSLAMPGFWNRLPEAGAYYLGVVGNNSTGVTCYVFNYDGFRQVLKELTEYDPTDMEDVSSGIAKQLADPMQYIVFCYWLPFLPVGKSLSNNLTIKFGYYEIAISSASVDYPLGAIIDPVADMTKAEIEFTIRKHPQASSRGEYLNQAPFSDYRISLLPFGVFSLDGSMMINDQTIRAEWWTDFMTGQAELSIWATNTLMAKTKAMFGIPINLSQAVVDHIGVASGAASASAGFIGNAVMGNWGAAVSDLFSGIGSAVAAKQPKISQLGGGGDFLPFCNDPPALLSDFYLIVDEYNTDLGRPLCKLRTPAALGSGYIQALNGEIEAPATQRELDEIAGYLTGGFFYE